jgi:DNA repair ATPase RecN
VHDHAHEHKQEPAGEKDPLAALMEQYTHAHDDAETNTFYEQSTRSLLKMALEQMWQSELHLRTYEPEKALPFEHKALEYLKTAQQKARTYVKKSGYDPPPIKEQEKRLTGELKDLSTRWKQEKDFSQNKWPDWQLHYLGTWKMIIWPKMSRRTGPH